jgi:hypothetical protein
MSKGKSPKNPERPNNEPVVTVPWKMPAELGLSVPRSVRFTGSGKFLVGAILVLAGGAIFSVVAIPAMNSRHLALRQQLDREGVAAEARVLKIGNADENGERQVRYEYDAGGRLYHGTETLPQWRVRELDGTVAVRYLASDPRRSWVVGGEPSLAPVAVIVILPLSLLAGASALWLHLLRQRWILAEGRAVEARIISTQKVHRSDRKQTRVEYEFRTLSGATRRVKVFQHEGKPALGSTATLLYDRENPNRVAVYPLSTVVVDRGL